MPAGGRRYFAAAAASDFLSDQKVTKESPGAAHAQLSLCYRAVSHPVYGSAREGTWQSKPARAKSDLALNFCAAAAVLNLAILRPTCL